MVTQTRHGGSSPTKLAFREKLVTKGQTTDATLRKLKTLHTSLADLDQENVDLSSLTTVKKDLLHQKVMLHDDRGVKAYVACCLVDILGLYAPEAPFTEEELCDIFKFIVVQLAKGLKGSTTDAYFPQYFHVLESLSSVKSIVLVCDLPDGEKLIYEIFRDFFALVRKEFSMQVETFMADILVALVDECNAFPTKCMDILLAQFTDRNISNDQPAFRLAVNVCKQTDDKLQRHVSMYFADLLVEHSEEEDLSEIRKAHDLIKHLHAYCPNLLHSVIPQLEEELRTEAVPLRTLATEVLGQMYADKGGVDLAKKYQSTWKVWMSRLNDKVAAIRLKAVEATRVILNHHAELRTAIREALQTKLLDPDERVRAATCKLYGQLDFEVVLHQVDREDLQNICGRIPDKKQSVRAEAAKTLGKMYNMAYPQIESGDPGAVQQFAWIPNALLPLVGMGALDGRQTIEQVIDEYIFPLPITASLPNKEKAEISTDTEDTRWTDRLLTTMKYLEDDIANNALLVSTNIKMGQPSPFQRFLDACIANNGGVIDENEEKVKFVLEKMIKYHASQFPDATKATEDLQTFAELNDPTLYSLLKKCVDPQTDIKSLARRREEFSKKMATASIGASATMKTFLRRGSYRIVNQSSIPTLLKRMEESEGDDVSEWDAATVKHARSLLRYVSKHLPTLFKRHQKLLDMYVATEERTPLTGIALQALSSLVRTSPDLATKDKRFVERLSRYAIGLGEKHAKFAACLLTKISDQIAACTNVVDALAAGLSSGEPEILVAHVAALAQFALLAPDAFESKSDVITKHLLDDILLLPSPAPEHEEDEPEHEEDKSEHEKDKYENLPDWMDNEDLPDLYRAKVLALKVLRNRCKVYAKTDKATLVSGPPLKVFQRLLVARGTLSTTVLEDPILRSKLRLQAAVNLVQLSAESTEYSKAILPQFQRIALTCQDSAFEVRQTFLSKTLPLLHAARLHEIYNIIPFLTVHDPEESLRTMAASYIVSHMRRLHPDARQRYYDGVFIRLMHFVAHHPDYKKDEDIFDPAKYIQNFLDLIATPDNISVLYFFAQKGKTVQDADPSYNHHFWYICEMTQEIIRAFATSKGWAIPAFPGKVKMPRDIMRPFKSAEEANQNATKTYLPKTILQQAANLYKPPPEEKKERKASKRKANSNGTKRRRKKRRSGARDNDDEGDEDDEDEDGFEDEDDAGTSRMGTSSDIEMVDAGADVSEDEAEGDASSREEQLGRGARQRAKRKAKRKVKSKG